MTATTTTAESPAPVAGDPPRRRWPLALALVLVLALLGAAAYVAYGTSLLGVRTVAVAGGGVVTDETRDEVVQAAGVADGTPLISLNLASVRRRVLAVPEVAAASVSRHWPHELLITVTARTPIAMTRANGSLWLLDATGLPYRAVTGPRAPAGLLTIDLATPGTKDAATLAALAVVAELTPAFRASVASVSAPSAAGIMVNLDDGRTVIWGSPDQGAKKLQILPAVLGRPGRIYDISDPDMVTVTAH